MESERLADYLDVNQAGPTLGRLAASLGASEIASVRNLDYVFAPRELYVLGPRVTLPLERLAAVAVDMDGTSTTTEPLALHALEYMVRRFTGRLDRAAWPGLDARLDHPHVIGNSNHRHTEFLLERYRNHLDPEALKQAFVEALCWTLANMDDPQRRRDIRLTARRCGLGGILDDEAFQRLVKGGSVNADNVADLARPFAVRHGPGLGATHTGEFVGAALDVYYYRYHAMLRTIETGGNESLSLALPGDGGRRPIEPMPGYEVFVPLVKGWLGSEAAAFHEMLRADLLDAGGDEMDGTTIDAGEERLARLGAWFESQPVKLAVVTASISYEARVVMTAVIEEIARRARQWPISSRRRDRIAERLAEGLALFDGFVNASDACEHRLKPHPDLYSLALHRMSIPRDEFRFCLGLEDTEPGIISLRAAGIGCAVALPNHDTGQQDYSAATAVLEAGLPELILARNLFLSPEATQAPATP